MSRQDQAALKNGGGGEIRTLGGLSPSLVFKTSAFNRSATPPQHGGESYYNSGYSQQLNSRCFNSLDTEGEPKEKGEGASVQ